MKIRTTNDHYGLNNCNGLPKSVMHFEEAQLVSHLAGSQLTELACKYLIHIRYLPTVLAFRTKLENGTTKKGKKKNNKLPRYSLVCKRLYFINFPETCRLFNNVAFTCVGFVNFFFWPHALNCSSFSHFSRLYRTLIGSSHPRNAAS